MKWGVVLCLVLAPVVAGAQQEHRKIKFIDMTEVLIHGEGSPRGAQLFTAKQRAKFDRLFRLKKDVLPRIAETARDAALR